MLNKENANTKGKITRSGKSIIYGDQLVIGQDHLVNIAAYGAIGGLAPTQYNWQIDGVPV